MQPYPESVVSTGMGEVNDQFKRFMVEWLQCEENVVDEKVTVYVKNPSKNISDNKVCAMHCTLSAQTQHLKIRNEYPK